MRGHAALRPSRTMIETDAALDAYLERTAEDRLASYQEFLRIPSISALPDHADDCRRAAARPVVALAAAGLQHPQAPPTGGGPPGGPASRPVPDAPPTLVP